MDAILEEIKKTPLLKRIDQAIGMIGVMCAEGRCPKMSIPVQPTDEDIFIAETLRDAKSLIVALDKSLPQEGDDYDNGEFNPNEPYAPYPGQPFTLVHSKDASSY